MKTKLVSSRKNRPNSIPSANGHSSGNGKSSKARLMLIDGKWVSAQSGQTFPTYNPATGEVICEVAAGDKADINAAVKAARKAFETGAWPSLTPSERGRLIWKLADLLEQNLEEF